MFEIYDSQLHTNANEVKLDYIHRVNEDLLPAYFTKALEFNLSALFAVPITGDLNKADYYSKVYMNELKRAKNIDSSQYPEVPIQNRPYVEVRR